MTILQSISKAGRKHHLSWISLFFTIMVVFICGISNGCGKSGDSTGIKPEEEFHTNNTDAKKESKETIPLEKKKNGNITQAGDVNQGSTVGSNIITEVLFEPARGGVGTEFRIQVKTSTALAADQYLRFRFWKNGAILDEKDEGVIPPFTLKKNDEFFADVLLQQGNQVIGMKRTQTHQVMNTPPQITNFIYPSVNGPGTYQLKATAEDIDEDELVFTMENTDASVNCWIDSIQGIVTFELGENPPKVLQFIIKVNDGDGGESQKQVMMKFGPKKVESEIPPPEPEEDKDNPR